MEFLHHFHEVAVLRSVGPCRVCVLSWWFLARSFLRVVHARHVLRAAFVVQDVITDSALNAFSFSKRLVAPSVCLHVVWARPLSLVCVVVVAMEPVAAFLAELSTLCEAGGKDDLLLTVPADAR